MNYVEMAQKRVKTNNRGELPNLDQFLIFLLYTNMKHCRGETNTGIR
jgi:hypothetical protein